MGKKNKDAFGGGRRRPMLDLGGSTSLKRSEVQADWLGGGDDEVEESTVSAVGSEEEQSAVGGGGGGDGAAVVSRVVQDQQQQQQQQPQEWTKVVDPTSGDAYYWHITTGQVRALSTSLKMKRGRS
jgi:hypothetical protein